MIKYKKKGDANPILLKEGKVPYFYFPLLEETGIVKHTFSTKLGGVSSGIFESLNFSSTLGDQLENVIENYHRMCDAAGFDYERIIMTQQTHTTNVRVVTEEMVRPGRDFAGMKPFTEVDGLVTNVPGAVLVTSFADCVPLYFVDPVHKAIGLSHSGRRGTVNRMGAATLDVMKEAFGTDPADVIACVGPSICQDCYEVGPEVFKEFEEAFEPALIEKIFYVNERGRYMLDLWKTNRYILLEAGIKEEHLAVTNVCTCCNHELLFSHRYTKGKRGNVCAFLSLKEE